MGYAQQGGLSSGVSRVLPFETGAEQSELLQQKNKEKDKSTFQEWPLV